MRLFHFFYFVAFDGLHQPFGLYYFFQAKGRLPEHENSSKAHKTDKGHQRPQSKKVTKSHFINHYCLIHPGGQFAHSTSILMSCIIKETNKDIGALLQS